MNLKGFFAIWPSPDTRILLLASKARFTYVNFMISPFTHSLDKLRLPFRHLIHRVLLPLRHKPSPLLLPLQFSIHIYGNGAYSTQLLTAMTSPPRSTAHTAAPC
jgi:hypothetical protein